MEKWKKKKVTKELIEAIRAEAKTLWEIKKKHHKARCILLSKFNEIVKEIEEEEE